MNKHFRSIMTWVVLILAIVLMYQLSIGKTDIEKDLTFSEFMDKVEKKEIISVLIIGNNISGEVETGERFKTVAPDYR